MWINDTRNQETERRSDRSVINIEWVSVKEERRTRGHGIALAKKQYRLDIRKFSFSQRTVTERNTLSADCVCANSVNMFKNNIGGNLVKSC